MASSKYKGLFRKKLNSELLMRVSNMKRENAYLKKTMAELSRQHSEHNKLVERFLSLATIKLESCQQLMAKDEKIASLSENLSKKEEKPMEVDSTSDKQASTDNVIELQNNLNNALEKNKQWLEYDQQREAYVRAILARMLWLEKQLNEANQARSRQHNEDHSDEKERMSKMQEHYERLLQKAKDELEVLREQVNMTQQELTITQKWYEEKEIEVEDLREQLQTEKVSRKITLEDCRCSEEEEQSEKTSELQHRLNKEKRRSTNFQLQAALCQKFMLNCHHADQEKISDLEQKVKIASQDLEEEKQNCSYLTKQLVRVLKTLPKSRNHETKQSKSKQQDPDSCGAARPPSSDSFTSSPHSNLLDESFLQCPSCLAEYAASDYKDLINHLEICLQ